MEASRRPTGRCTERDRPSGSIPSLHASAALLRKLAGRSEHASNGLCGCACVPSYAHPSQAIPPVSKYARNAQLLIASRRAGKHAAVFRVKADFASSTVWLDRTDIELSLVFAENWGTSFAQPHSLQVEHRKRRPSVAACPQGTVPVCTALYLRRPLDHRQRALYSELLSAQVEKVSIHRLAYRGIDDVSMSQDEVPHFDLLNGLYDGVVVSEHQAVRGRACSSANLLKSSLNGSSEASLYVAFCLCN